MQDVQAGAVKVKSREAVNVRKNFSLILACPLVLALAAGCGSSHHGTTGAQNEVPVVVTIHDAPPQGVTVLSFAVQITSIELQGGSTSGSTNNSGNLLSNPVTVQLQNLQTGSEILAQSSAAAGTYSGVAVTYGSVSASIQNNSGAAITVGSTSCANAAVCQINPTISQMSTTITSSPFPLTLTAGAPVNLALDFDVNSSLGTDLSVTPTVTVTASTTPLADSNLADIGGITGTVTATGTNQFTVMDSATGNSLAVNTATGTTFGGFSSCTASPADATCVQKNQIVNVNLGVGDNNPTTLTASSVNLENGFTQGIEGTVVAVNPTNNQFTVLVTGTSGSTSGVTVGQEETVTAGTGATFSVESNGATLPSGLDFTGTNNLLVGQNVQLDASSVSGSAVTADQVMLAPTQFTGTAGTVTGSNITINGLNGVFTNSGTTSITADTGATTTFGGVTGLTGVTTGNEVSVNGLLFGTPTAPIVITSAFDDDTTLAGTSPATVMGQ
jgi:hypothetical protein